jgi:hypothetical protein
VGGRERGWEGGRERHAAERFEMKGGRRQTPWASRSELIDGKNDARSRSSPGVASASTLQMYSLTMGSSCLQDSPSALDMPAFAASALHRSEP